MHAMSLMGSVFSPVKRSESPYARRHSPRRERVIHVTVCVLSVRVPSIRWAECPAFMSFVDDVAFKPQRYGH